MLAGSSAHAAFHNGFDWEAYGWKARVQTNAALNGNTYVAATRWFQQSRTAGLRPLVQRLNFMAGPNSTTARIPAAIEVSANQNTDTLTGAAPTYTEANGMTFTAGGSDMLNTGFRPLTKSALNSASLMIYVGGTAGQTANVEIGCQDFPLTQFFSMTTAINPGTNTINCWTNSGAPLAVDTNGNGFYLGSRTSTATNGVATYRNGVVTARSTIVAGTQPNRDVYVMGLNNGGAAILATGRAGRGYQIGAGFSDLQVANSYRIWQRFEKTLGRQVDP